VAAVVEAVESRTNPRPPLKWAGGKRWLVPYLLPLWKRHRVRRLVEPLCGGLAVSLGLAPDRALINDLNPHTINFYSWLKRGLRIPLEMQNDQTYFYEQRTRFNQLIVKNKADTKEAAAIFYYLNRTCYNGLCRFNSKGEFNVPFGRYKKLIYKTDFTEYVLAFAQWHFTCVDFENLSLHQDDFVYADPPYDVQFTSYSKETFGWADQVRLAKWLARHQGPVVLSNQATDRVRELYKDLGYEVTILTAPRLINCTGDRTPAQEVLATRNLSLGSGLSA
jgi:DNA adenine methylase